MHQMAVKATAATDNYKAGAIAVEHAYEAQLQRSNCGQMIPRIGIVSQEVNSLFDLTKNGWIY